MFNILAKIVKKVEIEERKRQKFLRFFGAGVFDSLVGVMGFIGSQSSTALWGIVGTPPIQQKSDCPEAVAISLNAYFLIRILLPLAHNHHNYSY